MEERKELMKVEEIDLKELLKLAIQKDASIDTFERLFRLREEVKKENARIEFFNALQALQSELKPIPTDAEVKNKDGTVRYKYSTLKKIMTEIQPLLTKYGFSISFETEKTSKDEIKVICILKHISGHFEKSSFVIPLETTAYMNDIQKMGSTLTYAKRYALMGVLNITTEDTDTDANLQITVENEVSEDRIELTPKQRGWLYGLVRKLSNEKNEEKLKELTYEICLALDSKSVIKEDDKTKIMLSRENFEFLVKILKEAKNLDEVYQLIGRKNE